MIQTLAIASYRSIRELVLPLGRLNVVTGANGSGKSSLYRALRLLAETAQGGLVASLAREGGLPSTLSPTAANSCFDQSRKACLTIVSALSLPSSARNARSTGTST